MSNRALGNIITRYMQAEAAKPCKIDKEGFSYICANKIMKGFAIAQLTLAILVLLFMPYYLAESLEVAYAMFIIAIFLLLISLRMLLTKYTLTDKGVICRTFIKKFIEYDELMGAAGENPPYINKRNSVVIFIDHRRKFKFFYEHFYGSLSFIQQLETEIGMEIKQKTTENIVMRIISTILIIIVFVIIILYLRPLYLSM